jgi:hypothetical protein
MARLLTAQYSCNPVTDYLANSTLVPYVLDEFEYFFETAFDATTPDFPTCDSDRPSGYTGSDLLPLINHYLDLDLGDGILIPDQLALERTVSTFLFWSWYTYTPALGSSNYPSSFPRSSFTMLCHSNNVDI